MPRFYFHIYNGFGRAPDDEGRECDDTEEARAIAVEGVRSLLSAEVLEGRLDLRGRIEVTGDDSRVVIVVPFKDALTVLSGPLPETSPREGSQ
ncbi:MAG: hypothetical protein AB7E79_13630 [Rhodospirillaceae bacterium]